MLLVLLNGGTLAQSPAFAADREGVMGSSRQWLRECGVPSEFRYLTLSQMKHQLDATLCRFYFCRVTLHVSGASTHHQEYLKLVQRPLVHVLSLQVTHHISLLGPEGPNKEMWWLTCNDNTCTSGRCTSFKYSWWWALAPETCRVTLQK